MAALAEVTKRTDEAIRKDVMFELQWDPKLADCDIAVAVNDGIVTLNGVVPSFWAEYEAEKAAKRVYGVRAVVNQIEVRLDSKRTDTEIAHDIVDAFSNHILIPSRQIKVTVRDGWVTLEGEVRWQFQRKAAEKTVRKIEGVTGISNEIRIKTELTPEKVQQKIEDAILRSAELEARTIRRGSERRQGDIARHRTVVERERRGRTNRMVCARRHVGGESDLGGPVMEWAVLFVDTRSIVRDRQRHLRRAGTSAQSYRPTGTLP